MGEETHPMTRPLLVACFVLVASALRADEVTLKNGTVYKDLSLVRETATTLEFLTLDGKKLTFSKDSILRHERRPTARDEYQERRKGLPPKDAEALFALAQWAREAGLVREAETSFRDVLKIEADHAGAREALGFRRVDGRWLTAAEADRAAKAAEEASYKERGWKKHGDTWMSPADFARVQKGLVLHEGRWVSKEIKARIDKDQWTWFEGEWVSPEDRQKMESGLRRLGGKWMTIEEIDKSLGSMSKPVIHKSDHFELRTNAPWHKARAVLGVAEEAYRLLQAALGTEPDIYDARGPLLILLAARIEDYKDLGKTLPRGDEESLRSSAFGSFYAASAEGGRGAVCTYAIEQPPYTWYFPGHGVAWAFVDRLARAYSLAPALLDALGAYAAAGHGGAYHPIDSYYWTWLQGRDQPMPRGSDLLSRVNFRSEGTMAQGGFFLHYAMTRQPELARAAWGRYLAGKGGVPDFMNSIFGDGKSFDAAALDADFASFVEAYRKAWRPWDK
jgi:tetratricopeptide (TPR) repeat protein